MLDLDAFVPSGGRLAEKAPAGVTETDDLARALDAAARLWPGESSGALVARIVREGGAAITVEREQRDRRRDQLVERVAGSLTGVYGPQYLEELRNEW